MEMFFLYILFLYVYFYIYTIYPSLEFEDEFLMALLLLI